MSDLDDHMLDALLYAVGYHTRKKNMPNMLSDDTIKTVGSVLHLHREMPDRNAVYCDHLKFKHLRELWADSSVNKVPQGYIYVTEPGAQSYADLVKMNAECIRDRDEARGDANALRNTNEALRAELRKRTESEKFTSECNQRQKDSLNTLHAKALELENKWQGSERALEVMRGCAEQLDKKLEMQSAANSKELALVRSELELVRTAYSKVVERAGGYAERLAKIAHVVRGNWASRSAKEDVLHHCDIPEARAAEPPAPPPKRDVDLTAVVDQMWSLLRTPSQQQGAFEMGGLLRSWHRAIADYINRGHAKDMGANAAKDAAAPPWYAPTDVRSVQAEKKLVDFASAIGAQVHAPKGMDAAVWAKAFVQLLRSTAVDLDEGLMIGWFANAIMAGYDGAWNKSEEARKEMGARLEKLKLELHTLESGVRSAVGRLDGSRGDAGRSLWEELARSNSYLMRPMVYPMFYGVGRGSSDAQQSMGFKSGIGEKKY